MYAQTMSFENPVAADDAQFFTRTSDVWDALYKDIEVARQSVKMEQYIFANDAAGKRFADLFVRKAKEGIQVQLILDALGSYTMRGAQILSDMLNAGVEIKFYNDFALDKILMPGRWLPRNHCKNTVIDDVALYIGSACIDETMAGWREMHMRLTSEPVKAALHDFDLLWRQMDKGKKILRGSRRLETKSSLSAPYRFISSGGLWRHANPLYKDLLAQIKAAEQHIYLVTPYFMPPFRLRRALRNASKRGVDVTILISEKSDVRIADWMARLYYPRLLRKGIKIYHFTRTVLHAKYAVIDERWATLGSTNMDYLSLLRNREANIITREQSAVYFMLDNLRADIQDGEQAHISDYRKLTLISDAIHGVKKFFGRSHNQNA